MMTPDGPMANDTVQTALTARLETRTSHQIEIGVITIRSLLYRQAALFSFSLEP